MFDMRAYVASLAAVFLALGIGILLGTIITDKGTVSRQQNVLLESIESRVDSVSENNKQLKKEVTLSSRFEKEVLPHVIQGKLADRHIALVHTGNLKIDLSKQIENLINIASGKLSKITINKEAFVYSPENINKVKETITSSHSIDENTLIPQTIASAISGTGGNGFLAKLKEINFINVEAGDVPFFSAVIIILNKETDDPVIEKFYKPLVTGLNKLSIPVVVAQTSDEVEQIARRLQDMPIMTIDNIDKVPGQISAIYGLAGRKGSFGSHERSQSLIPGVESEDGNN